jgi:hypothetical protein
MRRLVMLIEVDDVSSQEFFYDVLQEMVEDRALAGYFTLTDNGEACDLPDYMEYERTLLVPAITQLEKTNEAKPNTGV